MHVVIVGAYGSAGVAAAQRLAAHVGSEIDRLTLIDDGDPGGGLCILRGCMPSKEVLSAAAHRYQARHDHRLDGEPPELDLEEIVETKDDHVLGFAEHRRDAVHTLAEREGIEFVHDRARFVDDRTVAVGDREFEADYAVIATGSNPRVPDVPGIEDVDYMTSADVLDATSLPESGIVIGFGYVGLELVPYLVEAGVEELTVIEHDERPIDEADAAYGDELLSMYREEFGVEILTETHEERLEPTETGVRLRVDSPDGTADAVEAETLFNFSGRVPALDGLGLENTPIEPGSGWVEATMQSVDDDRTYVVGDVNAREPVLHAAKEQGHAAAANVLADVRGDELEPYENVHHRVIFSGAGVYPFARVGHSRASAEAAGVDAVAVSREASSDGVFKSKDVPRGLASLVVDAEDGTVVGYQGLHYHADVMAKTMQVIVELGLDVRELPDRAYHPTTPEILDGLFRDAKLELDQRGDL